MNPRRNVFWKSRDRGRIAQWMVDNGVPYDATDIELVRGIMRAQVAGAIEEDRRRLIDSVSKLPPNFRKTFRRLYTATHGKPAVAVAKVVMTETVVPAAVEVRPAATTTAAMLEKFCQQVAEAISVITKSHGEQVRQGAEIAKLNKAILALQLGAG